MRVIAVVLAQPITAEVTIKLPPRGVRVVGLVLRIGGLHQKGRTLNAVIPSTTFLPAPRPSENHLAQTGIADRFQIDLRQFRPMTTQVGLDQPQQRRLLLLVHLTIGHPTHGFQR